MNGFKLSVNNQDYFFKTDKKTKSSKFIKQVKEVLQADGNLTPSIAFTLRDRLLPAIITDDFNGKIVDLN